MKRKQEGWNIVLAGFWNRAIFSLEWVNSNVFQDTELETLLSVLPHFPIVYQNVQVGIEVSALRLAVRPRRLDTDCIQRAEVIARTILEKLPETPLKGVGINFAYVEEAPDATLLEVFDLSDDGQLSDGASTIEERKIARRLRRGDDLLNLTLTFDGSKVDFGLNYHTDTTDNATARTALTNRVERLQADAAALLATVYHLVAEEDDNG